MILGSKLQVGGTGDGVSVNEKALHNYRNLRTRLIMKLCGFKKTADS